MKVPLSILLTLLTLNYVSQNISVLPGSDKFNIIENGRHLKKLEYQDYTVITKGNYLRAGEKITVIYNDEQDTLISIQAGPIYFFGIYKDYLLIDKGTGTLRELDIYSLKDQGFINSLNYEYVPNLKSDSLFYDYPFPQTKEINPSFPNCPDSLKKYNLYGYSEKRIYIFGCKKSINTGQIKCEYRE
jgi:hypothetical protein